MTPVQEVARNPDLKVELIPAMRAPLHDHLGPGLWQGFATQQPITVEAFVAEGQQWHGRSVLTDRSKYALRPEAQLRRHRVDMTKILSSTSSYSLSG